MAVINAYTRRIMNLIDATENEAVVVETAMRYDGYTGGTLDHLSEGEFDRMVEAVLRDWDADPSRKAGAEGLAVVEGSMK
ncbi:MAG: hypothetical protein ACRDPE_15255 [Solirubrobacterales bacterium]